MISLLVIVLLLALIGGVAIAAIYGVGAILRAAAWIIQTALVLVARAVLGVGYAIRGLYWRVR